MYATAFYKISATIRMITCFFPCLHEANEKLINSYENISINPEINLKPKKKSHCKVKSSEVKTKY